MKIVENCLKRMAKGIEKLKIFQSANVALPNSQDLAAWRLI